MPTSFSISNARSSDPDLREEIRARTGSDSETSAILRCIERFGEDKSIGYYEITPRPHRGTRHAKRAVAWSVQAVRR